MIINVVMIIKKISGGKMQRHFALEPSENF